MKILVTGGAGYIGSHVVRTLGERGHAVLTFDDLSKGYREAVLAGELFVASLDDRAAIEQAIEQFRPDTVMHFAAFALVEESIREPAKYYQNNTANTLNLLDVMIQCNVRSIIFSSTAAVYGSTQNIPIAEQEPMSPINPYGQSKAFVEKALQDLSATQGLKYVSLRYFNAAGADPMERIGERHNPESHLIPLTLKAAKGELSGIRIFGTDYPTTDGTCIRDYIHVDDLAEAHILALEHLSEGGTSDIFNCGYGHGHSVREVVNTARKITGIDFRVENKERRPGDPPMLIADSSKLKKNLGWTPKHDDLEYIVKTAWDWEKKR